MLKAIIYDIETCLDRDAIRRVHRLASDDETAIQAAIGTDFPKPMYHQVCCLSAAVLERAGRAWHVLALHVAHAGKWKEAAIIRAFDHLIGLHQRPALVGFNSKSFDTTVLKTRAMMGGIAMPNLHSRKYSARFLEDQLDLLDTIANFDNRNKVSLDALSLALGLPGKPESVTGALVDTLAANDDYEAIADYCARDTLLTVQVFLRYELSAGRLTPEAWRESEAALLAFILAEHPELADALRSNSPLRDPVA